MDKITYGAATDQVIIRWETSEQLYANRGTVKLIVRTLSTNNLYNDRSRRWRQREGPFASNQLHFQASTAAFDSLNMVIRAIGNKDRGKDQGKFLEGELLVFIANSTL